MRDAMSTIPSIFNDHQIRRAMVGGKENLDENALNIAVILLNSSGSHFKTHIFENLLQCNFKQIVSVENRLSNFTDDISKKYPTIKFIIPQEETTDGELINLAMAEISTEYVLVLRDTINIPTGVILSHLAESLTKDKIYCVVPRLFDSHKNSVSCTYSPGVSNNHFIVESSTAMADGKKTLYPSDYIALYNREKFIQLGGFDWTIKSSYWQLLDLFVRSWLWGEETRLTSLLQFSYIGENPVENRTVNIDYLRYYLKNEMPKIKLEMGYIKKSSFLPFLFRSSCGVLEARRQFNEARIWVEKNKYKFKTDLTTFTENWTKVE